MPTVQDCCPPLPDLRTLTRRSVPKGPGRQGSPINHRLSTSCPIGRPGQYSLDGSARGEQPCSVYKRWEATESTVVERRERIRTELRHSRRADFSLPQPKPRTLFERKVACATAPYLSLSKLFQAPCRSAVLVTFASCNNTCWARCVAKPKTA